MTEIRVKKERYKAAIDMCCMPFCNGDSTQLVAHHLLPVSKGGLDLYDNLIVFCTQCHGPRIALHQEWEKSIALLNNFKLKAELSILGFDSIELSDDEFDEKLIDFLECKKYEEDLIFYTFEDEEDYMETQRLYDILLENNLDPHNKRIQKLLVQVGSRIDNEKRIMEMLDKRRSNFHDENLNILDQLSDNQLIALVIKMDNFNILLR